MPAGTITLTNNSATVTGSGTSFTSELKANDFIITTVGGVTYTLAVRSVNSATGLTLITAYNGPTTSGVAWTALPNGAMVGIPAQTAADTAMAIRGLNLDKTNWQQVYSASGNITVTLKDGSQYSGPSWKSLATSLSGLGDSATRNVGTTAGTVAAGNDSRLSTVNNKTGGAITSAVTITAAVNALTIDGRQTESSGNVNNRLQVLGSSSTWDIFPQYYLVSGQYHCFRLVQNNTETFRANSNGSCYAVSFNPTSDSNLKFNKELLTDALINTMTTRGMSYDIQNERKVGIIAQDVEKFMPEAVVINANPVVLEDGTILEETKSLDYSAIAGLHTEALKDIVKLMLLCLENPGEAKAQLQTLVSSINNSLADENKTDMKMEWALLNPPVSSPDEVTEDNPSEGEA
ncbi:tail fiber domain-containing protein [Pantoea sp. UYEF8]|uniref:tail fiber domain-containing protein n=1 Tax=Pantoea sp. UYEF8 TaxID=1756394 RepID=UPI003398D532